MTVGSLFAGIGGFDLAAERVFGPGCVRWQVEIDPWAQRVLAKHWPTVTRFSDIRAVTGDDLGPVDIVCGGFPCQDISGAGKRAGIEGERSGLWGEYARLLADLRPRFVVVENVAGLLVRGLGRVLGDLAALGYDAVWHCIPAAAIGAPHIRDRVWLVAYPAGFGQPVLRGGTPFDERNGRQPCVGGWIKAERCEDWVSFEMAPRHCLARLWAPQPGVLRVLDGVPDRVDRLRGCGNAIVPQVAEFLFRRIQEVA